MVIKITVNRNDLMRVNNRIKKVGKLPEYSLIAGEKYLKEVRTSVARQLMIEKMRNRSRAPRGAMKASILNARIKRTKRDVILNIPERASRLDLGLPKKVRLSGNARARKWVQKYYSAAAIKRVGRRALQSKPYGKMGKLTGYLITVRHPFVSEGHNRVRHRLRTLLKQGMNKAIKGG